MSAFLGISLWVALATVVPGLITLCTVYGALLVVDSELTSDALASLGPLNDWVWAGLGITVMILTQAVGILLEEVLIRRCWLGPGERTVDIPRGIDPRGQTRVTVHPYDEYAGLYILLAELQEGEDSQGHLKRALAQFFLTINSLVSFGAGIVVAAVIAIVSRERGTIATAILYVLVLGAFLGVTWQVARIRFRVMTDSLWAARRRRLAELEPARAAAAS